MIARPVVDVSRWQSPAAMDWGRSFRALVGGQLQVRAEQRLGFEALFGVAQGAGEDGDAVLGVGMGDPERVGGQVFAETAMDFANGVGGDGPAAQSGL
jgi:hypothetical protein